jgi:alpha-ketoglutarate-dependent taurine dioxygenase
MIETRLLHPERTLPLLVSPGDGAASGIGELLDWIAAHRAHVDERMLVNGAILFRGFAVKSPALFARFTRAMSPRLLDGKEENVPRTRLAAGIYTSTEYPAEYTLSMHSEYSYSHAWPSRLYFCCIIAPREQGETPIVDNREVLRSLDPAIVAEFERKKVMYLRNLHDGRGFGLPWQTAFQTTEWSVVEQYCREHHIECTWTSTGVHLRQVLDAVIHHPRTGEPVWFNQAPQFHPSDYPPAIYQSLLAAYKQESELPQNVCFGDGSPIDVQALAHIRETMQSKAVRFPWQEGDVLMIDNVLVAHGRMPFVGPRRILVAMSDA